MSRKVTKKAVYLLFATTGVGAFGNTRIWVGESGLRYMSLHRNNIAHFDHALGSLHICTAGWNTVTTRERLNGLPGVRVHVAKGQTYLNGVVWDNPAEWTEVR